MPVSVRGKWSGPGSKWSGLVNICCIKGCAQQVDVVLGSLPAEHWCRLEARVPIQVKALIPLTQDPFLELHVS